MRGYSHQRLSELKRRGNVAVTEQSASIKEYCAVLGMPLDEFDVKEMSKFFGSKRNVLVGFKAFVESGPGLVPCALVVETLGELTRDIGFGVLKNVMDLISLGVEIHNTRDGKIYSADRLDTQSVLDLALSLEYRPPPRRPKVAKP